jgi:hypothetical protein
MTSSFRDPYRMGSTNYLSTEADLTKSVNKEIDNNIKDTSEFYNQMAELERQRYDSRLDNLSLLADFVKKAAPIIKQAKQANEDRNLYQTELDDYMDGINVVDEEFEKLEAEEKATNNQTKEFAASAEADSKDPTKTRQEQLDAAEAAAVLKEGSLTYADGLNSKNDAKEFARQYSQYYQVAIKDDGFAVLDNRVMNDNTTREEALLHNREIRKIIFQNHIRSRRERGLRPLTRGEVLKYIAPSVKRAEDNGILKWNERRQQLTAQTTAIQNNNEVSSMFQTVKGNELDKEKLANDMLGPEGWITARKRALEAGRATPSEASEIAFQEFGDILEPMLDDVGSGVDVGNLTIMLDMEFQFPGGRMKMDDPRAPKGAKRLHARITAAVVAYNDRAIEQEDNNRELEILSWKDNEFGKFMEDNENRPSLQALGEHKLQFMERFNIVNPDQLPDWLKNVMTDNFVSDEKIILDITSRRSNNRNLPITESMVNRIVDPDKRAKQMKYVNTPELGAFTEEEAESMEERVVAIVKEAKQLRDLNQAKTDQYLVTRDNTKEFIISRFKELVIGGQSRKTAMFNAVKEAKTFVQDGTFDKEQVLPIDTQATKDLQATMKAIGTDPSLIYSSEEWAGEAPHLAIAREYIRTGGKSAYPAYYMRFNFIKDADGAYLTPEEIFETRVNKVDKKEAKIKKIPEREKLNNVDDQNALLNKPNPTKTLITASKDNNIEWMTSEPSLSAINARSFIRRLEENIQGQHGITGIEQPQYEKTTFSEEDDDKLFEAVPEFKKAPFVHPSTLSKEAFKALLNLNI